jgi:hypothetical protein
MWLVFSCAGAFARERSRAWARLASLQEGGLVSAPGRDVRTLSGADIPLVGVPVRTTP